jgi:pyruvate kinase
MLSLYEASSQTPADRQLSDPQVLFTTLQALRQAVDAEGHSLLDQWRSQIHRPEFLKSALNLAHYLALRRRDLRALQAALMPWGLSSLGRIEARVMPNLDAVIATLAAVCQAEDRELVVHPRLEEFFEGARLLQSNTAALFGQTRSDRAVRIMVTLPTEAASDYLFVREIVDRGADCVRINCAHDTVEHWQAMIAFVRQAAQETGNPCKIYMDLGGPKPRTGPVLTPPDSKRVVQGDYILLTRAPHPPDPIEAEPPIAPVTTEPGSTQHYLTQHYFQTNCSIPALLAQVSVGHAVWIDDGKIGTQVVDTGYTSPQSGATGVLVQVTHIRPEGVKLRADKGLNFPDTVLQLSPLTAKDLQDLDFVATHADIVGYSFVQTATDIALLQQELAARLGDAPLPAIVAKIETPEAVRNLPELIVQAAGNQSFGVMIARGDLAVEIGYQRLAEIQEEILWLCEAAHVPVIWATQVLENLVKTGAPSRGEITDAAMAERAECVMLNKGPFVAAAVTALEDVLMRMQAHQLKKTPQLRALHSWG